jgi:hypothetical protein
MPSSNLPAPRLLDSLATTRESRALDKRRRTLQADTSLELDQVRAIETIEVAKIEALETTGHVALSSAACLVEHRRFRVEQNPEAAGVFDHMVERTARAIGDRVEGMNRRLG